ncbi:hypothetical protein [Virgisporangium aurantiacum]|uniref:hypothetical protein n=1 Tax=Virgisporangium aurantiacum TaxID=175570 RepID=UPI0019508D86|nr:hypothetical protein [Virgisporangium aurantiacum]
MTDLPPFGARLARLLEHRGLRAAGLAEAAGVLLARIDAVLGGGVPDDPLLRRLAPTLGLHAADLFLIAARGVPDDLAPAELNGSDEVGSLLIWGAHTMDVQARARLRRFVDGLPSRARPRTRPFPSDGRRSVTPGLILRRLLSNRNIRINGVLLQELGGGRHLDTETYALACAGRLPLDDDCVNAFARVTAIPVGELAALLGLRVAELPWDMRYPWPADLVELAWAARRLDDEQLRAALHYRDGLRNAGGC